MKMDLLEGCGAGRPFTWQASRVGVRAKRLLALPAIQGKVLAVVSNAAYIATNQEEILWLAGVGLPLHMRGIQTFFEPGMLRPGEGFFVEWPDLQIGDGVSIKLDQATEWKPSAIKPGQAAPLSVVKACVQRFLTSLTTRGRYGGLGQSLPFIAALIEGRESARFQPGLLIARALPPIVSMAKSCLAQDMARVTQIGRELVGLGPGLTPAGDDFLGGLFFAAHSLKSAYPGDFHWDEKAISALIDRAQSQTHLISHAFLSDLSAGDGPEPLHELIAALLKAEEMGSLGAAAGRLLALGSTSGWDMLAGALTGMLMVVGRECRQACNPS